MLFSCLIIAAVLLFMVGALLTYRPTNTNLLGTGLCVLGFSMALLVASALVRGYEGPSKEEEAFNYQYGQLEQDYCRVGYKGRFYILKPSEVLRNHVIINGIKVDSNMVEKKWVSRDEALEIYKTLIKEK